MRLITIGLPGRGAWVDWIKSFERRSTGVFAWEWVPVADTRRRDSSDRRQAALAVLAPGDWLVALDERGTELTTAELHLKLSGWLAHGKTPVFVVGSADGLDPVVVERAHFVWSLSKLTWPHDLAAVMVAEQLYRVSTMERGHPYHYGH
jgi:rRNA large subunit m3Psi methyltransferase RlmH